MNKKYWIGSIAFLGAIFIPSTLLAQNTNWVTMLDRTASKELKGYTLKKPAPMRTGELTAKGTIELPVRLRQGQKYGFVGLSDKMNNDVDLQLRDADGNVVDQDDDSDGTAIVVFNPPTSGAYDLVVSMYSCQKTSCNYAVGAYNKK
jgi:hypothetical protein